MAHSTRQRAVSIVLSSLLLTSGLGGVVYAQQPVEQHQQEKQPNEGATHPQGHSEGTKPENMGSTGWTGGTGGSHIGTSNSHTEGTTGSGANTEAAKDQPLTATGKDLKGPPAQFPPNKTPE